jgi:DMSO/TMAO reductase YedYZ molybdopterin-dependent catalytic subunit
VLATAGGTVPWLRAVSVLGARSVELPVNRTAALAGVSTVDEDWRLTVGARRFSRRELEALPQTTAELPIACVEGWSASARWTGVPVRDLLALAGVEPGDVLVESLERDGLYRAGTLPAAHARDPLTLLALRVNGETLPLDHGYPCRLIAPNRPGVLQTKWLGRVEVLA